MKIQTLFVFDIDDTLTKSEFQHQTAYVNTMKKMGIHHINENWSEYKHMTDSYILKKNYEHNLPDSFTLDIVRNFENLMTKAIKDLPAVTEINGAKNTINKIIDTPHFGVCFATGSFLKPAIIKLKQADIPADPALVVGSNHFYTREEIVQSSIDKAKKYYNTKVFPNIISIGDGLWDLKTAQNLGIHFIGIGDKNKADFTAHNIPIHINDWAAFKLESTLGILNIL